MKKLFLFLILVIAIVSLACDLANPGLKSIPNVYVEQYVLVHKDVVKSSDNTTRYQLAVSNDGSSNSLKAIEVPESVYNSCSNGDYVMVENIEGDGVFIHCETPLPTPTPTEDVTQ